MIGSSPAMQALRAQDRPGRAHARNRAHQRRERHRQGAGRPGHPCGQRPPPRPAGQPQLPRALRPPDGKRAVRPREAGPSPAPMRRARDASSWPTAARSSSTKSPKSTCRSRPSCSACSRKNPSSASAPARRSASTSACWPPPTATCAAEVAAGRFRAGPLLPAGRGAALRAAAARTPRGHPRADRLLPRPICRAARSAIPPTSDRVGAWTCWSTTIGRATCASWRTSSRGSSVLDRRRPDHGRRTAPLAARRSASRRPNAEPATEVPVGLSLEEMERRLIEATLERFGGHREKTAKALGIGVRTLSRQAAPVRLRPARQSIVQSRMRTVSEP